MKKECINWNQFKILLNGLNEKTNFGKVVMIRSEKDSNILKKFNDGQKRIKKEWEDKHKEDYLRSRKAEEEANADFVQKFLESISTVK